MNSIIEQMLKKYNPQTLYDKKNAIKEIMQDIVLCGLSRAGFFRKAAFYGGTALRIFYGLDRFSEDLDFSLMVEDKEFDLKEYFPILEKEIQSFGLRITVTEKEKVQDSNIRSAFLKGSTKEHLLMFYAENGLVNGVASNEVVKIKFEVDINPPKYATFERKYRLLPVPCEINLYDEPSLFAGKLHAVICRAWRMRIKGRDLYDYVFYLMRGATFNLKHLRERLVQSGFINKEEDLTLDDVKRILCNRFESIDFEQAKEDVKPFIKDSTVLDIWSAEFFKEITNNLKI